MPAGELCRCAGVLALFAVIMSACGSDSAQPKRLAVTYVVMRNQRGFDEFGYAPHSITVRVGTRVQWINQSSQPHTVTSSDRPSAFDSGTSRFINPKGHWSFVFRRAGRYLYYCLLHPYMKGVVIVQG